MAATSSPTYTDFIGPRGEVCLSRRALAKARSVVMKRANMGAISFRGSKIN
jgi:hypothetical protein